VENIAHGAERITRLYHGKITLNERHKFGAELNFKVEDETSEERLAFTP
jgi:hypothetical protein